MPNDKPLSHVGEAFLVLHSRDGQFNSCQIVGGLTNIARLAYRAIRLSYTVAKEGHANMDLFQLSVFTDPLPSTLMMRS